jgi:chromosome segregation ATPase
VGWAKYFEDIQKFIDQAKSLSGLDYQSASSEPQKAIEEMFRVHATLSAWSDDLIATLDQILENATDPEINRQFIIDGKNITIEEREARIVDLELELFEIKAKFDDSVAQIVNLNTEIKNAVKSKNNAEAALDAALRTIEGLRSKNSSLTEIITKIESRKSDENSFREAMKKDGIRPMKK